MITVGAKDGYGILTFNAESLNVTSYAGNSF